MRHVPLIIVVVLAVIVARGARAAPAPKGATDVAAAALETSTLHSGVPGVRFGFGEDGDIAVDTTMQETGGMPYPTAPRKVLAGVSTVDPAVVWYAAEIAATTGCDVVRPCTRKPNRFVTGTVLVEKTAGGWLPIAWHIAKRVSATDQAAALAAGETLDAVPARIDAGAEPAAKQLVATIGDPKAFAASISKRGDVVLLGSSLDERWVGGAAVSARLAKWKLAFRVLDGIQAGASASGKVAWVAANVEASPVGARAGKSTPYRLTAIYELADGQWRIVQLHFSFATNPYANP